MASPAAFKNSEKVGQLAKATAAFGLDLYKAVSQDKDGQNIFFSPISVNTALGMTLMGAKGDTAEQMRSTLKFSDIPEGELHSTFEDLHSVLQTDAKSGYIMKIATRVFARQNYKFLQEYLDATKQNYKAEAALLDFAGDSEGSRVTINKWVEEQTNDKIKDLLQPGIINALTAMVLVNAVYFKGDWDDKFNPDHTEKSNFHLNENEDVECDLMFKEAEFKIGYSREMNTQIVELPYVGKDLSMVLFVPQFHNLKELEEGLTADSLLTLMSEMRKTKVKVLMPKFKLAQQISMSDTLKSLGMTDAFNMEKADLSGMDGTRDLFVSEVVHKAFVEVNEEGSEAAAATAVVMQLRCARLSPELRADKPFLFFIKDNRSNTILFMGRVANPAAQSA